MNLRKLEICAVDRLLLERFGGKVGRGQAVELTRQRNLPDGWKFYLPMASPDEAKLVRGAQWT